MVSPTICPLPFSHQHVQPNGEILFCCAARRNSNKNEDGVEYNVNTHSLIEAWNGPSIKKVRLQLINGETPEACQYCWERENTDHTQGTSMRMDFLDRIPINTITDQIEEAKNNNGVVSKNPFDFQIMSGNLCNLSCKMCTPQYSTSYSKFYTNKNITQFKEIKFSKQYIPNDNEAVHFNVTYDWPNIRPLNTILQPYFSDLKSIFLIGGEPTIIEGTFDFLKHMVDLGYNNNFHPFISTNCTNINKRLLDLLDQFRSTGINLSLDGMDDIAYIQRTPSRWSQIQHNVDQIMEWSHQRRYFTIIQDILNKPNRDQKFTNITVHSVITSLNLHHMPVFWKYIIDRYKDYKFGISFMPIVEDGDNFCIKLVPKGIISDLIQQTKEIKNTISDHKHQDAFDKFLYLLENTSFSDSYENIQYQLDQIQKFHPDMDIKKIYSIYYKDSL